MTQHITTSLVAMCQAAGRRVPIWIQGSGGNISIKERDGGGLLWIKASGHRLDQVGHRDGRSGIACVRLERFATGVEAVRRAPDPEQTYAALLAASTVEGDGLGRPSMETGFHVLLPGRWVLHLHSLAALLMVHEANLDPGRFESWWGTTPSLRRHIFGAVRPGWLLMERIESSPQADVYLLENHGVILQGKDADEMLARWRETELRFLSDFGYQELLEWSDMPSEQLLRLVPQEAPLRLLLPDTAVFLDRLRKVLQPAGLRAGEQLFRLSPGALASPSPAERDVIEIWLAQLLLLNACPELRALPEEIAATVANLPVEQLRRSIQGATP